MATEVQTHLVQRPLRGSRISTFYPVKSLPALSSLDSAFQLQEYISLLIRLDVHDVETITTLPGSHKDAKDKEGSVGSEKGEQEGKEGAGSEGEKSSEERDVNVDEACWIYEQLRRLAQDLTHPLITTLQQECSRTTCPEMKAGEWLYLCVAHGTEGAMEQCCAIDYILHTLDSATALLNSPRAFPSRLQIPPSSHRHFSSLARRLGRIFAHAYFHHREAFEQAEAESSLYARFLALTSKFDLVPSEFLVIPATASTGIGGDSDEEDGGDERGGHGSGGSGGVGGGGGGGSGFGLREVKLGTSYDPRRSGGVGGTQHQLPSSFQDEFPDVPRTRRLPQQYQQYPHQLHLSPQHGGAQQQQRQPTSLEASPMGGAESPRKTGRNRTHTMVLSEAVIVVDELAKASTAAADAKAEEEEEERKVREAKAREEAEHEQREKEEAEAKARHEEEELTSEEGEQKDADEGAAEKDVSDEEKTGEVEEGAGEVEEGASEVEEGASEVEEGAGEVEGAGESTDDVSTEEEESAVEALLAAPDQEPAKEETVSSEPEELAATPANAQDEESGTREVDIVEGAIASTTETTETTETSKVEEDEAAPEATEEVEAEADVTSLEVKEDLAEADAEAQEEGTEVDDEAPV